MLDKASTGRLPNGYQLATNRLTISHQPATNRLASLEMTARKRANSQDSKKDENIDGDIMKGATIAKILQSPHLAEPFTLGHNN